MFPLPFYSVWPYTPVIPAFYWNAKSTEEIIKHLACSYDHITAYFDTLTEAINAINADMDDFKQDIENRVNAMEQSLATLLDNLENVGDKMIIYDPTQGMYVDSKKAMRNMYRELAVFGARVNQVAPRPWTTWRNIVPMKPPRSATSPYSMIRHRASPTRKPATPTRPYSKGEASCPRQRTTILRNTTRATPRT